MKFLFWNIQKKPLGHLVRALVDEHDIDVVILAEVNDAGAILDALSASDLLDVFDAGSLQILERAEEVALLDPNSGRPNQRDGSDHLPILFSLRVGGGNGHEHT